MHITTTDRIRRFATAAAAIGALGLTACATAQASDDTSTDVEGGAYDITENAFRFSFDPDITFDDGLPSFGAPFVTEGYIYPAGTLTDGEDGVDENGDPTFPDEVVGTWTCHGHMIGDGARTETGAWVVSTQVYDIDGVGTIITDGTELVDQDVEHDRAVTGGTGEFLSVSGVQTQTLEGFNEIDGVVLGVEFDFSDGAGS